MKAGGNDGAGRGCNNQPSTGAVKAGNGWQQEQEDNSLQLAMKEDGYRPVMTFRDDSACPAGMRGTHRQGLLCHCCQGGAVIVTRGNSQTENKSNTKTFMMLPLPLIRGRQHNERRR